MTTTDVRPCDSHTTTDGVHQAECIIADHVAGVERTAWPEVLSTLRKAIAETCKRGNHDRSNR